MLMRFLWDKAQSKQDLLVFLQAVHLHTPVLLPSFAAKLSVGGAERQAWLNDAFSPAELENEEALLESALQLMDTTTSAENFAKHYELVAAGMSAVHAFRSAVRLERHSYKGGKEVPDCVEVVVREILELFLFDIHTRTFDPSRLPRTTCSRVVDFFQHHEHFTSSRAASEAWYELCQVTRQTGGSMQQIARRKASWGFTVYAGDQVQKASRGNKCKNQKARSRLPSQGAHEAKLRELMAVYVCLGVSAC